MKKAILLALSMVLVCPLTLLVLGIGNASIEAVGAGCSTTANPNPGGSFGIGTLNWRGASHYMKNPHPGERPYADRVPNMVAKIGASPASIIGFQEFEPPQAAAFLEATGGAWEIVAGKRRGKSSTADAIAYQPGAWKVDEVRHVSIRYGAAIIQVPLVRFTSTGGEGSIWVLNTHHPADAVGGTDAMRDAAVRTESQALRELQEAEPHTPLLLTGDMNDRARFKQLFLFVADGWSTANPGDDQIDWIMGSPAVTFSGTVVDQSTNDKAHHYTDHPFVHTIAQLTPPTFVGGDMNSNPGDGGASAATRMTAASFGPTADAAMMDNFYEASVVGTKTWEIGASAVHSDEPSLLTRVAMNGAVPSAASTSSPASETQGCAPCPNAMTHESMLLPSVTVSGAVSDAYIAAEAAHQAGFRGDDLVTAVAIARVESAWNRGARNGTHFGLWQIGKSHRGKVPGWDHLDDIYDPLLNAQYAFALYSARPGAAEAKFADWIPFQSTDYRKYLDVARQAVAATSGDNNASDATSDGTSAVDNAANVADTGCTTSTLMLATELSAELRARVDAMLNTPDGLCGLSWTSGAPCTYDNQCPKVVDAVYGGPGVGRGYGDGQDVAQGIVEAGLAHSHGTGLNPLPPVGAVVSYNTGNGVGHVAIYVGGGRIFGNDYGCSANGVYGCVGFADVRTPGGAVTWALPKPAFDLGGLPAAAA